MGGGGGGGRRPYLSQGYDALYVGVADVKVRDFLRLPGSRLHARRVLDVPVQRLRRHQVDHIINLKVQLHHLVGWTVQPGETKGTAPSLSINNKACD